MMMPVALEDLARQAIGGDREALDRLVRALQGDVYGLALRMLCGWRRLVPNVGVPPFARVQYFPRRYRTPKRVRRPAR